MTTTTPTVDLVPLVVPGDERSVLDRWDQVVAAVGDRPAASSPGSSFSFAAVDALSDALAARLRATAAPDGTPVVALLDHSAEGMIGMLAVVKAGRLLIPLDGHLPPGRMRQIVELAGSTTCLVDARYADAAAELGVDHVLRVDEVPDAPDLPAARAALADVARAGLADPLCIIFTSGSTGRPKGVLLTHGVLLNDAYIAAEVFGIDPGDRVTSVMPFSFAAGFSMMLSALLLGSGAWCYDPRDRGIRGLEPWMTAEGLTTLNCTPHLLRSLVAVLEPDVGLPSVRFVATVGEASYGRDVEAVRPHLRPGASYFNWTGTSEVCGLSRFEVRDGDPVPSGPLPAGYLSPNKDLRVVREDGSDADEGEVGELVVHSDYLSAGYWRDPGTEAAKFGVGPDGRRFCRTGDRGRLDGGVLSFAGRSDAAVKIRGYFVDPSEVETAILDHDAVAEAVVVAVSAPPEPNRLVAYVVPDHRVRSESTAMIRRRLRARLPEYMVPASIVQLPALPRNERGKVDRVALPPASATAVGEPPATHREEIMADLWLEVLGLDAIGRDDDFMELGGDSLNVEEMLTTVRDRMGIPVVSADLLEAPTLREFTARVELGSASLPSHPDVVTLRSGGTRRPVFCFAGGGALALAFMPIAGYLDDRAVYAFQAHGLEQRAVPDRSVEAAASRSLALIRVIQPHGPYILLGHSFGGLLALEVAHQLERAGESAELVGLLDTYQPRRTNVWVERAEQPAPAVPAPTSLLGRRATRIAGVVHSRVIERVLPDGLPPLEQVGERVRARLAGVVPFPGQRQFDAFLDFAQLVGRKYTLKPLTSPVLMVLADNNPDGEQAWRESELANLTIAEVRAEHTSMIREPHAAEVAALVIAELHDDGS